MLLSVAAHGVTQLADVASIAAEEAEPGLTLLLADRQGKPMHRFSLHRDDGGFAPGAAVVINGAEGQQAQRSRPAGLGLFRLDDTHGWLRATLTCPPADECTLDVSMARDGDLHAFR